MPLSVRTVFAVPAAGVIFMRGAAPAGALFVVDAKAAHGTLPHSLTFFQLEGRRSARGGPGARA